MERDSRKSPGKVLIVDDLEINVSILENIIQSEGYEAICALNVQEALDLMNQDMPQLILSDYSMPGMNGVEFCKLLKKNPKTRDIPFIVITVADSSEVKRTAFEAGAVDYIPKPFERMEVVMRVRHQMENYRAKQEVIEHNHRMHRVIEEQKLLMEKEQENLLTGLAKIVEKLDHRLGAHLERIGYNCRILAQSLQLTEEYEEQINDAFADMIFTAAKFHDIGALTLPEDAVREEDDEFFERHTRAGAELLREISASGNTSPFLDMAVAIAKYHHAHWDGTGCPKDVRGEEIPIAARIVSLICDFDAEYRRRAGEESALEDAANAVCAGRGTLYDPGIVDVFAKIIKRLQKI